MLEGYSRVDLADYIGKNRSFVSSPDHDNGIEVDYYLNEDRDLAAVVRFTKKSMGPPGHVHGGALTSVLDEAMGVACWFKDLPVVTRTITTDFLLMVPVDSELVLSTSVSSKGEGDVETEGFLKEGDRTFVRARARFAKLSRSHLEKLGMENVSAGKS